MYCGMQGISNQIKCFTLSDTSYNQLNFLGTYQKCSKDNHKEARVEHDTMELDLSKRKCTA